jgi:HAE1 family hydrophobic/amphiphilic exporter-1
MLVKSVISRPTTLLIIFMLIVGFGLYVAVNLAIDLYPEINPPILLIFTNYEGAGPEEIEKSITRPLEGVLSNVSNIEKLTSTSSEGSSQIMIEFTWGTNMAEASNDVRDKLEFVKDFMPDEASTSQIFKFDPSMMPILNLMVQGNRTPEELREIADKTILPRIEQIEGVALASVSGGRDRLIRVEILQDRLAAYNLTLNQLAQTLRGQNVQISAGNITEGSKNYLIRTSGEYHSLEEIKNTVVAYKSMTSNPRNPNPEVREIKLRDLANVFDGFSDPSMNVYINGQSGVYVTVQKQSGTNSVKTADNVLNRLPKINQSLPRDVKIEVISDTTKIIRDSLNSVSSSALSGAFLAVFILFIFLRSIKTTAIIGFSIPISIITTLMFMYFFNLTLNLMTLTGLALGIGMLVDNSIVILENIYRYREKGAKLTTAAAIGSQEMIAAITGSTLTTIVVFAPVVLFKSQLGMMGEMFASLSFTVVISLTSSLLVAIFLVPVLASKYLPVFSRKEEPLSGYRKLIDDKMGVFFTKLDNAYKNILRFVLKHRLATILVILAIFLLSFLLVPLRGFEFMPSFQGDNIAINVELPIGTKLGITESVLKRLETVIKTEIKGYRNLIVTAGQRSFFGFLGSSQSHKGSITITLPPFKERIDSADTVKSKLRRHFNDIPAAVFSFSEAQMGFGGGKPVDILIRTSDLVKGKAVAEQIRELIKKNLPEVTEPTVNLNDGLPQIEIIIDRDKAYDLGLNIYTIGQEIKANIDGITASRFNDQGSEYDILVILDPRDRDALPDLQKIFVLNASGKQIPLASFAHLERTSGPVNINREDQGRIIHVSAGIVPGKDLVSTETKIRELINKEIPADEAIVIDYSGDFAELMKYGMRLIAILLLAIALVFGIMAAQFESFLDPFIILFTMPLTIIGVIVVHVLVGLNFSMFTIVGIIVLMGVVVNNGIVLVDYTNLLRRRNVELFEACVEAGGNRLRPILMTTLTTVLGLLPLAFDKGEGLDLIRPIGITLLGGLSVSTFFTLFLIPIIYSLFNQASDRYKVKKTIKWQKKLEARRQTMHEALVKEHAPGYTVQGGQQ